MKQGLIAMAVFAMFTACRKEDNNPPVKGADVYVLDSKAILQAPYMYEGSRLITNQDSIKTAAVIKSGGSIPFTDPFVYGSNPVDSVANYTAIGINGDTAFVYFKNTVTRAEVRNTAKVEQGANGDMLLTYRDSSYVGYTSMEIFKTSDSINRRWYTVQIDYAPTNIKVASFYIYNMAYLNKVLILKENGELYLPYTTVMYRIRPAGYTEYVSSYIRDGIQLPFNNAAVKNLPENHLMIVQTGKIKLIKQ